MHSQQNNWMVFELTVAMVKWLTMVFVGKTFIINAADVPFSRNLFKFGVSLQFK